MASWFDKLLGGGKAQDQAAEAPAQRPVAPTGGTAGAPTVDVSRSVQDVLRLALRDTTRRHGVPADWVGCEVLSAGEGARAYHQVQLVLKFWDADFWLHANAFAQSYAQEVQRFSPEVASRIRGITWRVAAEAQCPVSDMPQDDYWSEEARAARERARKKDKANSLLIGDEKVQVGLQATQPVQFDKTMPLKREDLPKVDFEKTMPMKAIRNP